MAKLFAIAQMASGLPDTSPLVAGVDYKGHVLIDTAGSFGAYIFSGTGAQLTALNALATVTGIVVVTEGGATRWTELDGTIAAAGRTKLNTWLTNRGLSTIPAGWTYRQVLDVVYKRFNNRFDLDGITDISD